MNLGDVIYKMVLKMSLLLLVRYGGVVNIYMFIFYWVYEVIGVLGLVSVVIVCVLLGIVVSEYVSKLVSNVFLS